MVDKGRIVYEVWVDPSPVVGAGFRVALLDGFLAGLPTGACRVAKRLVYADGSGCLCRDGTFCSGSVAFDSAVFVKCPSFKRFSQIGLKGFNV